ncbi:S-layer homology domain-containing protein [Lysinibacillus sp. 3P01SB]|uniref:S-layer homology domain-containing protein n=1 Tax=Lysinibacillus sp. 3P01SB TaxID=3132284 RepID=UPI0039A48D7D
MANQPKKYKKFVATAATATLVASAIVPVASAASFSDVSENNEFAPYIDALTEAGIINGYPSTNTFKPGAALTRGQVVKMLGRWVESNGVEIPSDWNTKARFTDVPTNHKDQELVKYAALVADEGVFGGAAGKLMAGNNITRQQMAKVLNGAYAAVNGESLIEIAEGVDNVRIPDLSSARAEFEDAIQALMDLEISSTNSGNFRPLENVTRAQFSKFLYNTINFEAVDVAPFEVKAVNSTTVEVIFDQDIENIDKVKFAIEGLDIKGAVVKQTSKRTAVLTTSEQKGGTEYTVTVDGEKAGTFVGIAAVIPTAIKVNTQSVQGVIGEEVTLTAAVTVPEGQSKEGVSVTFNIVNNQTTNEKIEVEAFTNAEGVATYKYTRYYASEDNVAAYATKKSSVVSQGKVYWANKIQLAVSEITSGNELANNTKKTYKVNGKANTTYYVTVKENLGVTPDKVTKLNVQTTGVDTFVVPAELSTGGNNVVATVRTDADGEGTFTVYGSNLTATPIVYDAKTVSGNVNSSGVLVDDEYASTALQAEAPAVKYSQVDKLALTVAAEGTANSAEYVDTPDAYDQNSVGGRTYTVTVTDKDGKVAPEGTTAYVTFEDGNFYGDVYFTTAKEKFKKVTKDTPYAITVGKDGKTTFRVAGKGATTFAKPTVFLNTAGNVTPVALNKEDIQQVAEATYFKSPVVKNATLTVKDKFGRTVTSLASGEEAYFTYQSVDQNGFAYRPASTTTGATTATVWVPVDLNNDGSVDYYVQETRTVGGTTVTQYTLAFDVTSLFGNATVKDAAGKVLNASQNHGNTKTYQVTSDAEGKAIVSVTSSAADTVSVNVTGSNNILPTTSATVSFTNSAAVPALYTGVVESINSSNQTLKFAGKNPVSYGGDKVVFRNLNNQPIANADDFASLLVNAAGPVQVTYEVKDGVTTFYIYSIGNANGVGAPTDTAAAPTVTATLVDTDLDANEIGGTLAISANNSAVSTVTVDGTALTPVNGVYTVAQNTPANAKIVVTVVNAVGKTASTTVVVEDVVGDSQKAAAVDTLIEGFTTPNATQAEVTAARTAYDALTTAQKALVKSANVTKLQAEEAKLADAAKAAAVDTLIEDFTTPDATQAEVTAARTAYDALTTAQKALVKPANVTKLEAEEAKLAPTP